MPQEVTNAACYRSSISLNFTKALLIITNRVSSETVFFCHYPFSSTLKKGLTLTKT